MTSEWKTSTIGAACSLVTDGSHSSPKSVENGEYMVSVKDFTEYGFDFTSCRRISSEDYEMLKRNGCVPEQGDILIGKDGARYFEDIIIYRQSERPALLSSIAILRCNKEEIQPEFLYYTLRTPSFKQDVRDNYGSGSAIPRIILKDFKRMPISYPSIEVQKQITAVLSILDQRIQTNTKINDNLQQQAQALYKHYFPYSVGDELPDGWRIGSVGEIIEIHDSKRVPLSGAKRAKMEKKTYPYYGAVALMDYVDDYIFDGKYLLLGEDGTVVDDAGYPILQYVWGQFWVNNHAHILTGKLGFNVESLYMLFKQTPVKAIVTGAVQPKISQANLRSIQVVIPPEKLLMEYNYRVEPLFTLLRSNEEENKSLAALRDSLLPKLMSGEIDVSGIQL